MAVKEKIEKAVEEEKWTAAGGLGLLGAASSLGIAPVLIGALVALGISLVLIVYFLPLFVAGATALLGYFLAKWSGLRKGKLFLAAIVSGVGALILFQFVDVTLFSMGLMGYGPQAQALSVKGQIFGIGGALNDLVKILQLLLGLMVVVLVLVGIASLRALGEPGAIFAGAVAMMFTGVLISDMFNIGVPGLAVGTAVGPPPLQSAWVGILLALVAGIAVMCLATSKGR